jgi:hypothetical protein
LDITGLVVDDFAASSFERLRHALATKSKPQRTPAIASRPKEFGWFMMFFRMRNDRYMTYRDSILKKRLPMWQAEATVTQQFPSYE